MSDTHSYLDPKLFDLFSACNEIWHAGDFGDVQIAEELAIFKPFRGVFGNIDDHEVRMICKEHLHFTIEGLRVYMTHIGGYPGNYFPEAKKQLEDQQPGLFICGHSHICKVMRDEKKNLLHINPGAAGKHGLHKVRTAARFTIESGKIKDLEIIELGLRGTISS